MQFQKARGATNGDRIEPGALDQDILGGERNFGFRAAHDAADAHGARTVAVGNHADARVEGALDAVERRCFLAGLALRTTMR